MIELALTALALGLAGIDPAGLIIALAALAAGARERLVMAFTVIVLVGTAGLGTALTLTLGKQLESVDWVSLLPPNWLEAMVELAIATTLLAWAVVRLRRPETHPPRPRRRSRSGAALLWTGVVFTATAALDPTFVGLVVVAGRGEPVVAVASAHLVWSVVSQAPLVALACLIALRRHASAVAWLQDLLPRARPILAKVGTAALVLAGAVLAVDAVWWLVSGRFLLPDPS